MALFRHSQKLTAVVPPMVLEHLGAYGRSQADPQGGHLNGYRGEYEYDAYQASHADPSRFVEEVAAAGLRRGGWDAFGAHRCIVSMLGPDVGNENYLRVLDTAIDFLQDSGQWQALASPLEMRRAADRP